MNQIIEQHDFWILHTAIWQPFGIASIFYNYINELPAMQENLTDIKITYFWDKKTNDLNDRK